MKLNRCTVRCALCVVDLVGAKESLEVDEKHYSWCVYRHHEPLKRGEYKVEIKDDGHITSTLCYRRNIIDKSKVKSKRKKSSVGEVL